MTDEEDDNLKDDDTKDPFDEDYLYIEPKEVPANVPRDETMQVYAGDFPEATYVDPNQEAVNSDDDNDDDYENFKDLVCDVEIDWNEDARLLGFSNYTLTSIKSWIADAKREDIVNFDEDYINIDPEKLNEKQKEAYNYVKSWIDAKIEAKK